jgi:Fe-S-cluster containining protein
VAVFAYSPPATPSPGAALTILMADLLHPCLACGACCCAFRVDFSVHETQAFGGSVPDGLTVEVTDGIARMRGTDQPVRCAALTGKVGERAACGIYEWRPNPCRELEPGSDGCERARSRHGLPPLAGALP